MAITRRQFVTRLGALAAAVGMGQAEIARITEAFGAVSPTLGGTTGKPRVIWIHGAECTGCSTSLLGILENLDGNPLPGNSTTTTLDALALAGVQVPLTLQAPFRTDGAGMVNIADVVIDVVDLQYHETVMGMGGDLAAQWLEDFRNEGGGVPLVDRMPFVLVVEGALQDKNQGGAWGDTAGNGASWCSIGMSDDFDAENPLAGGFEIDMAETVVDLAKMANCLAVVPIGQCATYGGYPGCKPSIAASETGGEFNKDMSQTNAKGVYKYLTDLAGTDPAAAAAAAKVINVPGCPTNPWWFVLTVVALMVDLQGILYGSGPVLNVLLPSLAPNPAAFDSPLTRRLKVSYANVIHSGWCPRHVYFKQGIYAWHPGEPGCLQKLGCKGLYTRSLCGSHGWNNQQPQNGTNGVDTNLVGGGHCTAAGHPCMGCTEPGYPDRFVPFVKL